MSKRVLIADDHPLFREALGTIVRMAIPDCSIVEATDYSEAKTALDENQFYLAFVDLNMPDSNGLSDLALIKKMHPQIPMVVVSAHEDPDVIRACINHNASGYIIKSSDPECIRGAIKQIMQGNTYVPPGVDLSAPESKNRQEVSRLIGTLTPSQLKVFIEMGKGKLNKQIAYDLEITEATVKAHITTVFKKLHINNRTQGGSAGQGTPSTTTGPAIVAKANLTFWFDLASNYSYLSAMRIGRSG